MNKTLVPKQPTTDPRIVHAQALVSGTESDRYLQHKLINLYSKSASNRFSYPLRVFRRIASPNVVSWTALIIASSGSVLSLQYFISMLRRATVPNQATLAPLLKTCASLGSLPFALSLHSLSLKLNLSTQPYCASGLISFYSKSRLPSHARKVFDEMPQRGEFCYAALIVGLSQNAMALEALSLFADMKSCNLGSTMYSLSGALRAVSKLAALDQCRVLHGHAVVTGLDTNVVVGTALLDGYSKAGLVEDARQVFDENLPEMNIIGFNAMMAGYAQQGDAKSTLEVFKSMEARALAPDGYTFLAVLESLSNAGLVPETKLWFKKMKEDYGVEPGLQHYTCLVSAMGRAGQLAEAENVAMTMPVKPDAALWLALLSAAASHGEADMAKAMSTRLLNLDPNNDSAYVITSNALSAAGRFSEAAVVRKLMNVRSVKKESGRSWVEVRGKEHVFLAGDSSHEMRKEIYAKLVELRIEIEKLGYAVEGERKEALWCHSEKLAVAFAVVSGAALPGKVLRVVKNLRICKDCHEVFKYFSVVLGVEIVVRDANRYHRFLKGTCTCQDIW